MKVLSFILSIFIFALTVVPCTDAVMCIDHHEKELCAEANDHNDTKDCPEEEGCSPFCVCSCCQSLIIFETYNVTTGVVSILNLKGYNSYYSTSQLTDFYDSLFRPPMA